MKYFWNFCINKNYILKFSNSSKALWDLVWRTSSQKIKGFKKCQNVWISMWDNFHLEITLRDVWSFRDLFSDPSILQTTSQTFTAGGFLGGERIFTYRFSLLRSHFDKTDSLVLATKNLVLILGTRVPVFSLTFITVFTTGLHISNLILRIVKISVVLILIRLNWFWQFEHFQG